MSLAMMGESKSDGVLGLLIDETLPVDGAELLAPDASEGNGLSFPTRIRNLIDTATQAHDKMVIDNFDQMICHLPAQGYGTTEFNMSIERREALVAAGLWAAADYFDAQALEFMGPDLEAISQSMGRVDSLARKLLSP